MAAAFFGGPIAVTIIAVLNSKHLGRLGREWPLLIGVFAVGAVAAYIFGSYVLDGLHDPRSFRIATRAAGFVSFGAIWLMHKKELRALSTLGIKPRSPWVAVIGACVVAIALHVFIAMTLSETLADGV